jgi:hypothetical protein
MLAVGPVPSFLGAFKALESLDLSFDALTGAIPIQRKVMRKCSTRLWDCIIDPKSKSPEPRNCNLTTFHYIVPNHQVGVHPNIRNRTEGNNS